MSEHIRVGIVGASPQSWATAAHLPALAHLDELTVTAVATTRQDSARAAAGTFGIPHAFASAEELASHPEVDLVVVSVKVPAHAAVIRAALAAGKHVYAEWPLGVDLAEASALADAAAAAGVVHAVNLQAYHSPGAHFVADLLADGRIGPVESVSMTAAGDPLGGSRIPRSLAWSTEPAAGNNLLTVMAGHALAALERVAGPLADVSAVLANLHDRVAVAETGELIANHVPGQVALHGRLGSGALLSLSIHGGSATAPSGFAITISGTDGAATDLPVPGRYRLIPAGVPAGPATHIAALYREIAQAITEGRPAHPGFETAVHHHQTLAAIERAAQTGVRQSLAPAAGSSAPAWSTATAAASCMACSPPKPPSAAPASTSGHPASGGRSCTSTTWPCSTWPSPPGRHQAPSGMAPARPSASTRSQQHSAAARPPAGRCTRPAPNSACSPACSPGTRTSLPPRPAPRWTGHRPTPRSSNTSPRDRRHRHSTPGHCHCRLRQPRCHQPNRTSMIGSSHHSGQSTQPPAAAPAIRIAAASSGTTMSGRGNGAPGCAMLDSSRAGGRSASSPPRSRPVRADRALVSRSSNSAWSSRPCWKCSPSSVTTASRSASDTRRSGWASQRLPPGWPACGPPPRHGRRAAAGAASCLISSM